MKHSDLLWLKQWMQAPQNQQNQGLNTSEVQEELFSLSQAELMDDIFSKVQDILNFISKHQDQQLDPLLCSCRVFKIGSNRPGIMIVRNGEKLLVVADGVQRIRAKLVKFQGIQEIQEEILHLQAQLGNYGEIAWVNVKDQQRASADIVVKSNLSRFLSMGSQGYSSEEKTLQHTPT